MNSGRIYLGCHTYTNNKNFNIRKKNNMKKLNLFLVLIISAGLTTFVSCTDDLNSSTDSAITATTTDDVQVENINDEVINSVDEYALSYDIADYQKVKSIVKVDSVIVTANNTDLKVFPKLITIDYGTGFTTKRGNVLKGKLLIELSNRMSVAGSIRTITYDNFYVNENKILGTKTVTYNGLNSDNKPSKTTTANDSIIRPDGIILTWQSNRTRTRIDDNATTLVYWDDIYSISGNSSGINAKGKAYSMTIDETNPLIAMGGFKYFVKGTVIMKTENKTAVLDYGDGTKDAKATLTINGVTKDINLKK